MQAQSFAIMAQEQLQQGAGGCVPTVLFCTKTCGVRRAGPAGPLNQETEVPLQAEREGQPWFIAVHCPARQELKHCNPDSWDKAGTQQGHLGAAVPLPDFPPACLTGRFWLSHGCSVGTGCLWAVQSKALELPQMSSTKGLLLHGHLCFRTLLLLSWESKNCTGSSCAPCELCLQPLLPSPAGVAGADGWEWVGVSPWLTHGTVPCSASLPLIYSW